MGVRSRQKKDAREAEERRRKQILRCIENISDGERHTVKALVTFGTEILKGSDTVLVKLGDNDYRKCLAADLREGQEVVFSKKGLNLGDIRAGLEKVISQGSIYRHLLSSLFTTLENGDTITTFSHLLLQGISTAPHMWPRELAKYQNIESILDLDNGIRTCYSDAQLAAETIHARLVLASQTQPDLIPPALDQIRRRWITGEVILPKNYRTVIPILSDLSPGLVQLVDPKFESEYNKYRALRLSISLRLTNTILGKTQRDEERAERIRSDSSNLSESDFGEIQRVVQHFGDSLSPQYATAPILRIELVKDNLESLKEAQQNRVISELPSELEGSIVDANEITKRALVLGFIVNNELRVLFGMVGENILSPFNNVYFQDRFFSHFGYSGFLQIHKRINAKLAALGYIAPPEDKAKSDGLFQLADTFFEYIVGHKEGSLTKGSEFESGELIAFFSNFAKYRANVEFHALYDSTLQSLATAYYNKDDTNGLVIEKLNVEYEALKQIKVQKGIKEFLLTRSHLVTISGNPIIQTACSVEGISQSDVIRWMYRFHIDNDRAFDKLTRYQDPNYWKGKIFIKDDEALNIIQKIGIYETVLKIWKYNERIIRNARARNKQQ